MPHGHIAAETKWYPLRGEDFQTQFLKMFEIHVLKCPINDILAAVHKMLWRRGITCNNVGSGCFRVYASRSLHGLMQLLDQKCEPLAILSGHEIMISIFSVLPLFIYMFQLPMT